MKKHGSKGSRTGRPGFGRRSPPPRDTGLEQALLQSLRGKKGTIVAHLAGGDVLRGRIESVDGDLIRFVPDEGPERVLRTAEVRYLSDV